MFKLRVKFLVPFKDGNILEGRGFRTNEVADLDEMDVRKIQQSGGEVDILDTLVPNPLKKQESEAPTEPPRKSGKKDA